MDPFDFSVSEEPRIPFELLDGSSEEGGNKNMDIGGNHDNTEIRDGSNAETVYQNMYTRDDDHEILDISNAVTGKQNMETSDDNNDPDFK